ncbi:unnamed protein product [Ectocarpus sp. 6 AP-2014]
MPRSSFLIIVAALASWASPCGAFAPPRLAGRQHQHDATAAAAAAAPARTQPACHVRARGGCRRRHSTGLSMSTPAESPTPPSVKEGGVGAGAETTIKPGAKISNEWELDVYSRPVVGADGKKLWELLICDSTGNFRHVSPIPSNMVNSREVRRTIEGVIEAAPGGSKPTVIRFFRNAMFNMIDIALKEVEVAVKPCRTTYAMYQWLEERERDVYPAMAGFKPTMKQPAFFDIRTPTPLPDALRGEQYAFVTMPVSEFRQGNINDENVGVGRLCPLDASLPDDAMIPGLAMFTARAEPLATWMTGLEVAYFKADLKNRELALECGINTQYLVARVQGDQRKEAQGFEEAKRALGGFHFVAVQSNPDADDVAGFWLLKEVAI